MPGKKKKHERSPPDRRSSGKASADHDGSYKRLFGHPEMVADLLRAVLRVRWIESLDFGSLFDCSNEFVTDKGAKRRGDLLWRATIRCGDDESLREVSGECEEIYFYIALEFQSTIDQDMPVRIATYRAAIRQRLAERNSGRPIPEVLPIVIYNGEAPWNAAANLRERLARPLPGLESYREEGSYLLVEMRRPEIANQRYGVLLAILAQFEQSADLIAIRRIMDANVDVLSGHPIESDAVRWVLGTLARFKATLDTEHFKPLDIREMKSMLAEKMERWGKELREEAWKEGIQAGLEKGLQEGRQKGLLEGLQQGQQKGLLEGRLEGRLEAERKSVLRTLITRFGSLPDHVSRKVGEISDSGRLDDLLTQALTLPSLEEFERYLG